MAYTVMKTWARGEAWTPDDANVYLKANQESIRRYQRHVYPVPFSRLILTSTPTTFCVNTTMFFGDYPDEPFLMILMLQLTVHGNGPVGGTITYTVYDHLGSAISAPQTISMMGVAYSVDKFEGLICQRPCAANVDPGFSLQASTTIASGENPSLSCRGIAIFRPNP